MRVRLLEVENFRGVSAGRVVFQEHTLLVGGNNIGKSTICEALELALGPERLYRRPIIDEHDFFKGEYHGDDAREIRIKATLIDPSEEQERQFFQHLRLWNDTTLTFLDEKLVGGNSIIEGESTWALPVIFIGRYDHDEDDFIGETFFDHRVPEPDELDEQQSSSIGAGRSPFTRAHKRLCGFLFLRALRTGSRALSLQRGSLLDTILRLGGDGAAEMWQDALRTLKNLDPAIGEIEQLKTIRDGIRKRLSKFVSLVPGDESVTMFASDLTREHLREVVRLFVATEPNEHSVPFTKQGTGSINLMVFALLTMIADLKGDQSVIFVMEEPEIALPPHTQRRVAKYVVQKMGQSIVTSHSPYIIEQFAPENVVILSRGVDGELTGSPINTTRIKPKRYRTQRKQFAEAILSRAVFVLEGQTEMVAVHAISSALEEFRDDYSHIDLSGVTLFNAEHDKEVPRYAPIFRSLGKRVYGMRDKPNSPEMADTSENIKEFDQFWESPEWGIEQLLVKQVPNRVLRSFLDEVVRRDDFPTKHPYVSELVDDDDLADLAVKVLSGRKGDSFGFGYTAMLIEQCLTEEELPSFIRDALLTIDKHLSEESEHPKYDETSLTL